LRAAATLWVAWLASGCEPAAPPPSPSAAASAPSPAVSVEPEPASYLAAKYDPVHFKPAIETATDQQCLACHAEVLKPAVRKTSPAGLESSAAKAWYQQLSTYAGEQDTFHRRHLETALAKQLMNLRCNTCHQGSDPRDRAPGSSATTQADLTLRKTVSPEGTCLKCHGQMNWPVMGLPGPWEQFKEPFQNNCVVACHSVFRTVRHQVNYLNAKAIEEQAAKPDGGDVCFGCHGGRVWYRINYPYPRHPWPDMPDEIPDWAKDRPTVSEARFIIPTAATAAASQGEQK
jgi:nitrate/TMAO reductase-like tetraheme cytochrome c subunit